VNFLAARKILREFDGGSPLKLLVGMSGTPDTLELFLRAAGARYQLDLQIRTLPFNTLQQTLQSPAATDEKELFVVFPWDLAPALDWRSGIPTEGPNLSQLLEQTDATLELLMRREKASICYVPAPIPPIFFDANQNRVIVHLLSGRAAEAGAMLLSSDYFALASYLASGAPFSGARLGEIAEQLVAPFILEKTAWKGFRLVQRELRIATSFTKLSLPRCAGPAS